MSLSSSSLQKVAFPPFLLPTRPQGWGPRTVTEPWRRGMGSASSKSGQQSLSFSEISATGDDFFDLPCAKESPPSTAREEVRATGKCGGVDALLFEEGNEKRLYVGSAFNVTKNIPLAARGKDYERLINKVMNGERTIIYPRKESTFPHIFADVTSALVQYMASSSVTWQP